jgi:hypothetical protein
MHGNDLGAVGAAYDRDLFVGAAPLGADIGIAIGAAEPLGLVVADDDLIALADDRAVAGLLDDDPIAFPPFTALTAQILDADP